MNQTKREILVEVRNYLLQYVDTSAPETILYITTCGNNKRGDVWRTSGADFERAWVKAERYLQKTTHLLRWTKVEIQTKTVTVPASEGIRRFYQTGRNNYFSQGVAFKKDGSCSFLPDEISGNALLVPEKDHKIGQNAARLQLNLENIKGYIKRRFGRVVPDVAAYFDDEWDFFDTAGIFIEEGKVWPLTETGFGRGMRQVNEKNQTVILQEAIERGRDFLFDQLWSEGKFTYGYFPAYDKRIPSYNSVRHFSSLYALLETIEYTEKQQPEESHEELLRKVESALDWGLKNLCLTVDGVIYVGEKLKSGYELKLGAQAIAILALAKYESLTGYDFYHETMLNLLEGMHAFIDEEGHTSHVLFETLETKERFRIIYYNGEALFAIMRAYPLTGDDRWLKLGELLMDRYVADGYERYHDHWLSYSVNELTQYLPKREYYEFGVKNALENLNFMEGRDTAYPTFLELLCAANKMFRRIEESPYAGELFTEAEYQRLRKVTEKRAIHELRTGVMWPEYAIYFARPETIVNGFYARHDRTRMRIDDAEHFLSGLINYTWLLQDEGFQMPPSRVYIEEKPKKSSKISTVADTKEPVEKMEIRQAKLPSLPDLTRSKRGLTIDDFSYFTGEFLEASLAQNITIHDFEYYPRYVLAGNHSELAFIDIPDEKFTEIKKEVTDLGDRNGFILEKSQELGLLITSQPNEKVRQVLPQFIVPDVWEFMHEVASYLRNRFEFPMVAITGSVGKSSLRLMLEHLLKEDYSVLGNRGNLNARIAIPLCLNKLAQDPDIAILEVSLNALNNHDRGPQGKLVRPDIAILTSIDYAHMRKTRDLKVLAKIKARLLDGLQIGGTAIINGDIEEEALQIVMDVAKSRKANILTYSLQGKKADLRLIQIKSLKNLTEVTVEYKNRRYTYQMEMASEGMAENSLAAVLTLISLGLELEEYLPRMLDFHSFPKVMAWHQGYLQGYEVAIIDDTHNAAIPSMINGIRAFSEKLPYYSGRKILALGQVADLGAHMIPLHRTLVPIIDASGADILLAYGEGMKTVVAETKLPAIYFEDMDSYVAAILAEVTEQSLILLKGSVSASDYHKVSGRLLSLLSKQDSERRGAVCLTC